MKSLFLFLWLGGSSRAEAESDDARGERSIALVPLLNFTTDRGLGFGAYGAVFLGAAEPDSSIPYLAQIGAQYYRTTGGYQDHKLIVDLPHLGGDRVRAEMELGIESWDGAFYFGEGNQLPRLAPDATPPDFYAFGLDSIRVFSQVRMSLVDAFDLFVGQLARTARIEVFPDSRLEHDRPTGIEGGLLSQFFVGAMYDTRDHEFAPNHGAFSEFSLRAAHTVSGSDWTMWGGNFTDRRYWTLLEEELVLATRGAIDVQGGEVPFFHQMVMGGSQWVDIGGRTAMRGLPIGRYRGNLTTYGDAELRWEVTDFEISRGHYRLFAVSFLSGARILDEAVEPEPGIGLHGGFGGGLRLLYDEVFLARLDLALGREEYTSADEAFGTETQNRGWVPGVYLAFDAPY